MDWLARAASATGIAIDNLNGDPKDHRDEKHVAGFESHKVISVWRKGREMFKVYALQYLSNHPYRSAAAPPASGNSATHAAVRCNQLQCVPSATTAWISP